LQAVFLPPTEGRLQNTLFLRVDPWDNPIATSQRNAPYMIKKLIAALVLGGILLTASACNTVKGVGRDIESVGQAGSNAIK
jgi:entericidin B